MTGQIAKIKAFYPVHASIGESPLWRGDDKTYHYVDVLKNSIHILDLSTNNYQRRTLRLPAPVTFIAFHCQGGYLAGTYQHIVRIKEDDQTGNVTWEVLRTVIPDEQKGLVRLNDGCVDCRGRLWFGSLDIELDTLMETVSDSDRGPLLSSLSAKGSLFRYDPDGSLHTIEKAGIACSNGIGWSPDYFRMYHTDSSKKIIWVYDFDPTTGSIHNKRISIDRQNEPGEPDGLIVDMKGDIYTFIWNGSRAEKYDGNSGQLLHYWNLNAYRITHGAWIGEKLSDIAVLSAKTEEQSKLWEGEEGGAIFWLTGQPGLNGVSGMPKMKFGDDNS